VSSLSDVVGLLLLPEKAYSVLGYKKDIICQELTCHFVPGEGLSRAFRPAPGSLCEGGDRTRVARGMRPGDWFQFSK
jgi:hypothetical protein